ncbi:MAG: hypothetical protein IPP88_19415 [Betaproteobacteria bacterium]|nr:hypothetical protein [Betaproteobacteria bacterium]
MTQSTLIMIAVALLVIWRLYSRMRRLIGRQRSRLWRHWFAAIFLPLLLALLASVTLKAPQGLAALVAGTIAGIGLAVWGLRLTRFEKSGEGFFYTPNAHIGIGLSLLLVARVGYRFYTLSALSGPEMGQSMQAFGRSPLTLVILGTMLGYFAAYAIGLLRWRRTVAAVPLANFAP